MHVHFLSPVVNYHFSKNRSCHFFTWASNCKHTSVLIVGHHPTDGKKILEWEPGSRLASKAQGGFVGQRHGAMACDSVKSPIMAWDLPNQPSNQPVGPKILHRYGYTSNNHQMGMFTLRFTRFTLSKHKHCWIQESSQRWVAASWGPSEIPDDAAEFESHIVDAPRNIEAHGRAGSNVCLLWLNWTGGNLSWWPCQNDETLIIPDDIIWLWFWSKQFIYCQTFRTVDANRRLWETTVRTTRSHPSCAAIFVPDRRSSSLLQNHGTHRWSCSGPWRAGCPGHMLCARSAGICACCPTIAQGQGLEGWQR